MYKHDFHSVSQEYGRKCCEYRSEWPIVNLRHSSLTTHHLIDLLGELQDAFDDVDTEKVIERALSAVIELRRLLRQSRRLTLDKFDTVRDTTPMHFALQEPGHQEIEDIRAELKLEHIDKLLEKLEYIIEQFELSERYIGWDEEGDIEGVKKRNGHSDASSR